MSANAGAEAAALGRFDERLGQAYALLGGIFDTVQAAPASPDGEAPPQELNLGNLFGQSGDANPVDTEFALQFASTTGLTYSISRLPEDFGAYNTSTIDPLSRPHVAALLRRAQRWRAAGQQDWVYSVERFDPSRPEGQSHRFLLGRQYVSCDIFCPSSNTPETCLKNGALALAVDGLADALQYGMIISPELSADVQKIPHTCEVEGEEAAAIGSLIRPIFEYFLKKDKDGSVISQNVSLDIKESGGELPIARVFFVYDRHDFLDCSIDFSHNPFDGLAARLIVRFAASVEDGEWFDAIVSYEKTSDPSLQNCPPLVLPSRARDQILQAIRQQLTPENLQIQGT